MGNRKGNGGSQGTNNSNRAQGNSEIRSETVLPPPPQSGGNNSGGSNSGGNNSGGNSSSDSKK